MSLTRLLIDTGQLYQVVASDDGLGDSESSETLVETFPCRVRQLTAKETYQPQGDSELATFRIYITGSQTDHPAVQANNIILVGTDRYRIQVITPARSTKANHLEIDCISLTGE